MTDAVSYQRRGAAGWIRLSRPERCNAVDAEVLAGVNAGLDRALGDDVRVVVLTGSGPTFCAGADLSVLAGGLDDPAGVERLLEDAGALTLRIEAHPTPVIAAVNGAAIAGGLELVLACDLVVAAEGAVLGDGHANWGLVPGAGSSVRLPRLIGANRARWLLFTGESLTARQACDIGLVNQVVPDGELDAAVDALCQRLAARSAAGLRRMKRAVAATAAAAAAAGQAGLPMAAALARERAAAGEQLRSADAAEGLAAFAEHREPKFG